MVALKYHEVLTTLQGFVGDEQSIEAQQYLNSIAGETVVVPGNGPTIRASQVLKYYNKQLARKTISDARMENPPRKLTMESGAVTAAPATISLVATEYDTEISAVRVTEPADLLIALRAFADDARVGQSGQGAVAYKNLLADTRVYLYDLYLRQIHVKAADALHYTAKGFAAALPTIEVTGTAISGGVTEAEIVNGGETLIFTLTNGTWAATTAFNALRASVLALLRAAESEAHGWNVDVVAAMAVTDVVRTSDTVMTVTLPAAAAYSITADEEVTVGIPAGLVVNEEGGAIATSIVGNLAVIDTATFTITAS